MPIPRVLAGITVEPGRPRLTWYDTDERVELSGHVLDNWVMKAANLLVEEYQAGPGTCVLIDLPVHWRAVIWAMATWRVGGCVVLPGEEHTGCDVVITDRPEGYRGTELVAVALPVMARQFDGELPPGALDAAEAVMTYGDVLTWIPEPDPQAPALVADRRVVPHAGLLDWAAEAGGASGRDDGHDDDGAAPRVLLEPGPDGDASRGVARMLARLLSIYVADGSAVLCSAAEAEALAEDPARRQRLIETELVTASGG
jgi:uncharacterized protein (TIGR03089 family)